MGYSYMSFDDSTKYYKGNYVYCYIKTNRFNRIATAFKYYQFATNHIQHKGEISYLSHS